MTHQKGLEEYNEHTGSWRYAGSGQRHDLYWFSHPKKVEQYIQRFLKMLSEFEIQMQTEVRLVPMWHWENG